MSDDPRPPAGPPGLPEGSRIVLGERGVSFFRRTPGPEGAPTLLLLHGWTASSALNWFACYGPLSRHFDVVAIDHRGHGRGIRSRRRFHLEDCADDAVALLDALDIDRVIPVGYSMGGPIAQLLWRRHPERVGGLVMCATSRYFVGTRPGERAVAPMIGFASLVARATPDRLHRSVGDRLLTSRYDETELGRWARREAARNSPRAIIEAGHALVSFSSVSWVGSIDVPTAVVVTEADSVVPPRRQRGLAAAIPTAVTYRVHGDHAVCAMRPSAFVPTLVRACVEVSERARARVARPQAG
jgi:3-oxoadipate enol-lactonase